MLPNVFNFIFLVLWKHLHCVQLSQKGEHIKKKKETHKIIFTATGGKSANVFKWAEQVISRHF